MNDECSVPVCVCVCVPHVHCLPLLCCSEYTHKVEETYTFTADSPPCMVTPTTANIHELKVVRLVYEAQMTSLQLKQQRRVTFTPSLCLHSPSLPAPLPPSAVSLWPFLTSCSLLMNQRRCVLYSLFQRGDGMGGKEAEFNQLAGINAHQLWMGS